MSALAFFLNSSWMTLKFWIFNFSLTYVGMEAAAVGHSVPSALCVRCFSTSALWMFSTLSRHWGIISPTWWTYWWGTLQELKTWKKCSLHKSEYCFKFLTVPVGNLQQSRYNGWRSRENNILSFCTSKPSQPRLSNFVSKTLNLGCLWYTLF